MFHHEYNFVQTLTSAKNYHGKSFGLTFRFINLLSMKKGKKSSIYPKELELDETTESNTSIQFDSIQIMLLFILVLV